MLPAIQVGVFSQPIVEQILLGFALRGPVSMVKRKREKGGGAGGGERPAGTSYDDRSLGPKLWPEQARPDFRQTAC